MLARLASYQDEQVQHVDLADLDVSVSNVRRSNTTADIDGLAASLQEFGLLQPIVVERTGSRYSVIIGQRRFLAAKRLGWPSIPAFVLDRPLDAEQRAVLSLSENIQRRDLSAHDRGEACFFLLERLGTISKVADTLDVSSTTVRRWLGYRVVPDAIKTLVADGRLTSGQATRIANYVEDEETATEVAMLVASQPTARDRQRVLESAAEMPGRSAATIARLAEEKKRQKQVIIHLPESAATAIDQASEDESVEPEEIAFNALMQWLEENGYL